MGWYAAAKFVHVTCVGLSVAGFVARFVLMVRASPLRQHVLVRILPHVIDTVLLGAAIAMLVAMRLNPLAAPWLSAKIAGLVVYVYLGAIALRSGRTMRTRAAAFLAALAAVGYIVAVALTKSPLAPVAWLAP